jgi:ribose transport system ATP-binding protein
VSDPLEPASIAPASHAAAAEEMIGGRAAPRQASDALALEVTELRKSYGANRALDGVHLRVRAGEVHALLGQNGCGKSTLVKCLTGVEIPDSGEAAVFGSRVSFPVGDPRSHGIAVIHQDIGLVDAMTVLENLGVAAGYGTRAIMPVSQRAERKVYADLMARLDVHFDLDAKVATLSPAERALLGVLRAFRLMDPDAADQLFILDEPTAALSRPEAARILRLMRRVADLGYGVIFISHRLQEVMEVCDSATVMRSGKDVAHVTIAETTRGELIAHMLGRRMDDYFPTPPPLDPQAPVRLSVSGLSGARVTDVSFEVRAGEVVGVTGLAGMGQEEVPFLLSGATRPSAGTVAIDGDATPFARPSDAIARRVALVPGNRLRDGVWAAGSAEENMTLPLVRRTRALFPLAQQALRKAAANRMQQVAVHPPTPQLPMSGFSGGNQQKIVFGKWMQLDPAIFLLDEPTQGVDPGSAKDLLTDALELARGGACVVIFSGDHEQLAAICHRVIVLHHGRVVDVLQNDALTEERLLAACEAPVA